jgi:hypothetical protein
MDFRFIALYTTLYNKVIFNKLYYFLIKKLVKLLSLFLIILDLIYIYISLFYNSLILL